MTNPGRQRVQYVVRPLPSALLEDCTTYLEEQLYNQGFATLSSALLSGFSNSSPLYVPPPQHLALAATLSVHPSFTTRTLQAEKHKAAQAASAYLRHVQKNTTVETAGFARAFVFGGSANSGRDQRARLRRSAAVRHSDDTDDKSKLAEEDRQIHNSYAREQSLFRNADDFWSVVGWSFNCSVKHPNRWVIWKTWLQVMLDLLEDDIQHCKDTTEGASSFQKALICQYMFGVGGRLINIRRIMRAIFADGSAQTIAEFPEIWRNEARPPKRDSQDKSQKRKQLDIENDEFADYFDADSDTESVTNDPNSSAALDKILGDNEHDDDDEQAASARAIAWQEGSDPTIVLRQRLLAVISSLSFGAPELSIEPYNLASLIAEFVRPLPIGNFMQFTLPLTSNFSIDMQFTISEMLLKSLVAGDTPATDPSSSMTQDAFEKWYAPRAASSSSAVDNAKVSVLVESVLRNLWQAECLPIEKRDTLVRAVEVGIAAREKKAGSAKSKTGKKHESDGAARAMLQSSAKRLQAFIATLAVL